MLILQPMRTHLLLSFIILAGPSCGRQASDSAGTGSHSLSERLTDTTWACRWISLNAPLYEYPSVSSRVEVAHTLTFTATTMSDDLPERLDEWAATSPESYARDLAYASGFNEGGTADVEFTMEEVNWTAVSEDELLFSIRDSLGRWSGNVAMTVRWDSEGMWMATHLVGWTSYSRCDRT